MKFIFIIHVNKKTLLENPVYKGNIQLYIQLLKFSFLIKSGDDMCRLNMNVNFKNITND